MSQTLNSTSNQAYRQTKVGEIPLDWDLVSLEELIADGPQNGIYKSKELYGEGTPIVRIDDFNNDGVFLTLNLQRVRLSNGEETLYSLNENDILINRVNSLSHLGKCTLIPNLLEATVFESNMMRFHVDETRLLPEYLFRYLISNVTRKRLRNLAKRAVAQSSINQGDVKSLLIPVPPLPEQRAIAHTLRTIQKAKEVRQRELELEQERKAALTQHFFTHGTRGEALKQTELGFIPDSWIVSRFDSFGILQRGFDITKKEQEPGEYPVISSSGISSYHNSSKVKGPGVIIGRKGTLGTVHYVECDYWPHDTTLWVKEFKGNHPRFTAYFLASLNLKRFDCGASNPTLNRNTVHAMTIAYPQKEEQQEIAAILNACDRKITALEQEAAFLDELFRAMLEELMTGRLSALPLVEKG
jgi:type I restriction enzyme S subunit